MMRKRNYKVTQNTATIMLYVFLCLFSFSKSNAQIFVAEGTSITIHNNTTLEVKSIDSPSSSKTSASEKPEIYVTNGTIVTGNISTEIVYINNKKDKNINLSTNKFAKKPNFPKSKPEQTKPEEPLKKIRLKYSPANDSLLTVGTNKSSIAVFPNTFQKHITFIYEKYKELSLLILANPILKSIYESHRADSNICDWCISRRGPPSFQPV